MEKVSYFEFNELFPANKKLTRKNTKHETLNGNLDRHF